SKPPSLLGPRLSLPRNVIGKGNHLRPNEPMLKVRMDNARGLGRSCALPHGPSPHFLRTRGEIRQQTEQGISTPDDTIEPRLLQTQLGEKLRAISLLQLPNLRFNSSANRNNYRALCRCALLNSRQQRIVLES